MWTRYPRLDFEEPRPSPCGKREAFSKRVWARTPARVTSKARPYPRQGRQLPQAASKLYPRAVWERGYGGEGARSWRRISGHEVCGGGRDRRREKTRPLAARRSDDVDLGRPKGRPVFGPWGPAQRAATCLRGPLLRPWPPAAGCGAGWPRRGSGRAVPPLSVRARKGPAGPAAP